MHITALDKCDLFRECRYVYIEHIPRHSRNDGQWHIKYCDCVGSIWGILGTSGDASRCARRPCNGATSISTTRPQEAKKVKEKYPLKFSICLFTWDLFCYILWEGAQQNKDYLFMTLWDDVSTCQVIRICVNWTYLTTPRFNPFCNVIDC